MNSHVLDQVIDEDLLLSVAGSKGLRSLILNGVEHVRRKHVKTQDLPINRDLLNSLFDGNFHCCGKKSLDTISTYMKEKGIVDYGRAFWHLPLLSQDPHISEVPPQLAELGQIIYSDSHKNKMRMIVYTIGIFRPTIHKPSLYYGRSIDPKEHPVVDIESISIKKIDLYRGLSFSFRRTDSFEWFKRLKTDHIPGYEPASY